MADKWGRPTDLTQEVIDSANAYLLSCEDTEVEKDEWQRVTYSLKVKLPSIEWLARHIKVARSTIYEWRKLETPLWREFSDIIEDILSEQAEKLLNNWLSGDYNPTIAKVILTKHWYTDKSETALTWKDWQSLFPSLTPEQLKNIGSEMMKVG